MASVIKTSLPSDQIRIQEKLAIVLAFIAGYMDAAGLIKWKTYVSFMSGNTTQLGIALSHNTAEIVKTSITVISFFVLGIYAGTCLSLWKKMKTLPFYIVSGLLIFYMIISFFFKIDTIPSVAIIGFSLGIMNTIVTSVGNQKVNTDFVTGTLNSFAVNVAMFSMTKDKTEKDTYKANALHLLLLWIGFLFGAFISTQIFPFVENWMLSIPVLLLIICAILIDFSIIKV